MVVAIFSGSLVVEMCRKSVYSLREILETCSGIEVNDNIDTTGESAWEGLEEISNLFFLWKYVALILHITLVLVLGSGYSTLGH